jgi:hypothetical protein
VAIPLPAILAGVQMHLAMVYQTHPADLLVHRRRIVLLRAELRRAGWLRLDGEALQDFL